MKLKTQIGIGIIIGSYFIIRILTFTIFNQ